VASLLIALATCPVPAFAATDAPPLVFHGNLVLNDEVYLAVLDLPPDFVADQAGAQRVRERLLDFLHRTGYEIARVEVAVEEGRVSIDIDEGRVENVVLSGQGSIRTVQMLFALSLPYNVFNRPYLERQLAAVHAQMGVEVERFDLVPVGRVAHLGAQVEHLGPWLDDLGRFVRHPLIPPRAAYELQILFRRREWPTGFAFTAALSNTDGLRLGIDYLGERALLAHDRWLASVQLGGKVRVRIADDAAYPALQRVGAQLAWFAPPLAPGLRPGLALKAELTSRQRPDIGLESYMFTSAQLAPGLSYDLLGGSAYFGIGVEQRDVFALQRVAGADVPSGIHSSTMLVPYVSVDAHFVFDADEVRRDRHHEIEVNVRHTLGNRDTAFGIASYNYRRVFEIGWHDLRLSSRGAYVLGVPPFVEEQPIGGAYVRGVYGTRFYSRRAVGVGMEARFSLIRDIYKVGAFTDFALFREIDRTSDHGGARAVTAFGPTSTCSSPTPFSSTFTMRSALLRAPPPTRASRPA
jgi:hypothetical protein